MLLRINIKLFCISSLLILQFTAVQAQKEQKVGIGLNISNNLVNILTKNYSLNGGFAFEPIFRYKLHSHFDLNFIAGYTKVSSNHTLLETNNSFQEIDYNNKGGYVKIGLLSNFGTKKALFENAIGLHIGYTNFIENGTYLIQGNYFGDLQENYETARQSIVFIEPMADILLLNWGKVNLFINFSFPISVYSKLDDTKPRFFIPGLGERQDPKTLFSLSPYRFNLYLAVAL